MAKEYGMTRELAQNIIQFGGREFNEALSFFATDDFLHRPEKFNETVSFLQDGIDRHFISTKIRPAKKDMLESAILAGTMGTTYFLLSYTAYNTALDRDEGKLTEVGSHDCYVVLDTSGGDEPLVTEYEDPFLHNHMRTIVQLMKAGEKLNRESYNAESPFARYRPVWQLEEGIREAMPVASSLLQRQYRVNDLSSYPLDHERIRRTGVLFLRNIMHHTLLVDQSLPGNMPMEDVLETVIDRIKAAETAAKHPRDVQRTAMGIHGRQYRELRAKQNLKPHMTGQGSNARVARLENSPPHPSLCPAQDPHELPIWLRNDDLPSVLSPAEMIARWSNMNAPHTLFLGRPFREEL